MEISPYLSMITLNANGLNFPIERYRQSGWMDLKKHPSVCCLQETHFRYNDTERLKEREQRKICPANGNIKKAGVAILTWDKVNFKTKTVIRDKEGHYIMIKGSIQQEDITLVNICALNTGGPNT